MAKIKDEAGAEQDITAQLSEEQPITELPKKVMLSKAFVLCLQMPGQSASVTTYHREGKPITDKETIKNLIDAGADLYILEQ